MNNDEMQQAVNYFHEVSLNYAVDRERTEALAQRLGLNPDYVESITYWSGDAEDGTQPHISVTMRNFTAHLPKDFDLYDEDHQLPDMSLDLAKATAGLCSCYTKVGIHGYTETAVEQRCGHCAVEIER